jgi:uncharacterized membrane protein
MARNDAADAVPLPENHSFARGIATLTASADVQHIFVLGLLLILYAVSTYNYLIYHSLIEVFTIVVASCIFVITWNSRGYLGNSLFVPIGIAFSVPCIITGTMSNFLF